MNRLLIDGVKKPPSRNSDNEKNNNSDGKTERIASVSEPMKRTVESDSRWDVNWNFRNERNFKYPSVIIDSGASHSMFPASLRWAFDYYTLETRGARVSSANASEFKTNMRIIGTGDLPVIEDVYCIENLGQSVIGVSQYDKKGYKTTFAKGIAKIQYGNDKDGWLTSIRGTLKGGTYEVDDFIKREIFRNIEDQEIDDYGRVVVDVDTVNTVMEYNKWTDNEFTDDPNCINWYGSFTKKKSVRFGTEDEMINYEYESEVGEGEVTVSVNSIKYNQGEDNDIMTIHKKYGHLSENRIKLAIRDGLVNFGFDYSTIKDQKLPFCIDCMRGRMKASARKNTTHTQYGLFEKIAHDWKGPFPIKSVNGYSGYHLFSDNYSNWLWAYFDKGKDRLFGAVIRLHKTFIDEKTRVIPLVTQPNWRVFQSDYENVNISRGLRD